MRPIEKWIWLPNDPGNRKEYDPNAMPEYRVVEFSRTYTFPQKVVSARLRFSGDTEYLLCCNGKVLATGPIWVGGDFLGDELPRGEHYAAEMRIVPDSDTLTFYARVKRGKTGMTDYTKGRGGFMLTAEILLDDGTETVIMTDESWLVRVNAAYVRPDCYDGSVAIEPYQNAAVIPNIWHCSTAPIPPRCEQELFPIGENTLTVAAGEQKTALLEFDKIWGGFIKLNVKTLGLLKVKVECTETGEPGTAEEFVFTKDTCYRGIKLHSVGGYRITAENLSGAKAKIACSLIETHYPVTVEAKTVTSDPDINRVFDVCSHTLKICRQMIHLDSTRHVEPLACTGDYYIETLMTAFTYGDMSLAAFDVRRTAELLRYQDGKMFHTTYSLIWVQMLYDVYQFTGEKALLCDCKDALILLLNRFETYLGENGLIETPTDYMFIDWLYPDEISTHHPPKALGQTCLNLFYFGALQTAVKIYEILGQTAMANRYQNAAAALQKAIIGQLYDSEKGLFFEGLNTPTPTHLISEWMPENVQKRYYRTHANILAAYFGIFEREGCRELLHKVMQDKTLGLCQPYFKHFLLEAVERNGLREQYTLQIIEEWKEPTKACDKGLVEGFYKPEPTYSFDHSHAWGGTPAYSLPKALLGFEMVKPGFAQIRLHPSLLGLDAATVEMPTPYGMLTVTQKRGQMPHSTAPKEIEILMKD